MLYGIRSSASIRIQPKDRLPEIAVTGSPQGPETTFGPPRDVVYLSPADERANVLTHGAGLLLSLLAMYLFFCLAQSHSIGLLICCLIFTVSMALVYLFSTLSHAITEPHLRNRMRAWDQGTIYLLIAGTYSPFLWQGSPSGLRTPLFCLVWAAACFGFYSKVLAKHRINAVSTATYLALGWLPALPLIGRTPWICFLWMLLGGLSYSIGVVFLKKSHQVRYSHALWHTLVMLGSACHGVAIYKLLELSPT